MEDDPSVQPTDPSDARGAIMTEEDWVVQKFDPRCPYCDQVIAYEGVDLRPGENEIICPSCRKVFIKVVGRLFEEEERK